MNELLRDMLAERANSTEPPAPDLDGIIAAGDRRITRRRAAAVVGGGVLTVAAIAGGISVARSIDHQPAPAKPPAFSERRATYALGTEIHYGNDVISVAPHRVNAFVQIDAGFVFLDNENDIYVADRVGVRRIVPGKGTWRLTADAHGSLVGWVEGYNDHSESVVYDVAAGRELVRTPIGNTYGQGSIAISPRIVAIDGDHAYLGTLHGLYRWDVKANKGDLLAVVPPDAVRTVTSGLMVYQQPLAQPTAGLQLAIGPMPSDTEGRKIGGQQAFLSPGAKYLLTAPDDYVTIEPGWNALRLYEVATGKQLALPYADHSPLIFSQWLDDNTFTAVGVRRSSPSAAVDLLTCSAQSLTCEVTTPGFSTFTFDDTPPRTLPFALPLGTPIYNLYR